METIGGLSSDVILGLLEDKNPGAEAFSFLNHCVPSLWLKLDPRTFFSRGSPLLAQEDSRAIDQGRGS